VLLKELSERSPMRVFENSIHGGLGAGNLGVVVGPHGTWKTAFLVDIALDDLLRGRKVLHVTLSRTIEHVYEYYVEIFRDLARASALENGAEVRREVESHRHIKSYVNEKFTVESLRAYLQMLRESMGFVPVALVIDGYDFDKATLDSLRELRAIAKNLKCEIWMAAHSDTTDATETSGIPAPLVHLSSELSVIVLMANGGKAVNLRVLKDHDNPDVSRLALTIDPTTMLLVATP